MRFDGTLKTWHDDRGFGFFVPTQGGEDIFVHISQFRRGFRPSVGQVFSFEVELGPEGKKRAVRVEPPVALRAAKPAPASPVRRTVSREPGVPWLGIVAGLVLLVAGGLAVARMGGLDWAKGWLWRATQTEVDKGDDAPDSRPARVMEPEPAAPVQSFRCDGRTHCSQMRSCAEATFFNSNCPGTQMDGNHDGVPCEKQWCGN